jgi:ubiquinol-cytochrome c reductase iron-sulfur subunit
MTEEVDPSRRQFLTAATLATGAVGTAFAIAPFIASWKPSARAKALGAPVSDSVERVFAKALAVSNEQTKIDRDSIAPSIKLV